MRRMNGEQVAFPTKVIDKGREVSLFYVVHLSDTMPRLRGRAQTPRALSSDKLNFVVAME